MSHEPAHETVEAEPIINRMADFKRITPANEHWFYGYYDNPAFSPDDRRHLAHRVAFRERLQRPEDVAHLGIIDLETGETTCFAETKAWNFQQGSMLQWLGNDPDSVFFNSAEEDGTYRGTIVNPSTGATRHIPMPLANVARDGSLGLSINFDRVFDFRPGYGYCQKRDPWFDLPHPEEDGVWIVDVATGSVRQVLTMQKIWEAMAPALEGDDAKICINHITFNPSADHFVLLARNFPAPEVKRWITTVFISDLDGNLSAPLFDSPMASHYWWADDQTLIFYAGGAQGYALYSVDTVSGEQRVIDAEYFVSDGHCSTSPDGQWMLYDRYPREGRRELYLYNLPRRRGVTLGALRDLPGEVTDVRCDLHPRWNRRGTAISLDGTCEGYRGVYIVELEEIMNNVFA